MATKKEKADTQYEKIIDLGKVIRKARKTKGLNLKVASAQIGVSTTTIHQIEAGINLPGGEILRRICAFFEVDAGPAIALCKRIKLDRAVAKLEME